MAAGIESVRIGGTAARLVERLRIGTMARALTRQMPRPIRSGIARLRARRFVATHDIAQLQILPVADLKRQQRRALEYLIARFGSENVGDYVEFGVFAGTSMTCMSQTLQELGLHHVRLFGFDSFEGMPAVASSEDEGTWEPGQFKFEREVTEAILAKQGVDMTRVTLIQGWFNETLTPELRTRLRLNKAAVIMVDCDLYSSTVDVLRFCEPLIGDQAVLFFDDWHSNDLAEKELGEKKAFDEFLAAHPEFTIEDFGTYVQHAACFVITRHS